MKIAIEIDCDGEYCGKCRFRLWATKKEEVSYTDNCLMFYETLKSEIKRPNIFKRCKACLDATEKELDCSSI